MDTLPLLARAARFPSEDPATFSSRISINLITNVTDAILSKLLIGLCLDAGIYPDIYSAPYHQYLLELKDPASGLVRHPADISFVLLDINAQLDAPMRSAEHAEEVLHDLEHWCATQTGSVVITSAALPYRNAYGNLFEQDPLFKRVKTFNERLGEIVLSTNYVHVCDLNRLLHSYGADRARDLRQMHASDLPFTNDFSAVLCSEWFAYVRALRGRTKKCIVLDLDNTVWGGIVGETGALGVTLGPDYPGSAFVAFQRALLDYRDRGILLAVNSRNNPADAQEVFEKNPYMVLKPTDLAAVVVNWNDKAENLTAIAAELNIGVDSLVFFDDDAMNRALVRAALPDVLVPELSDRPEEYVAMLHGLDRFHQFALTEEDLSRSRMAADEHQRKQVRSTTRSVEEYIAQLDIRLSIKRNDPAQLPRLAQLTQKTNQFNLTTTRLSEGEISQTIDGGGWVFGGDVADRFGAYGLTLEAIISRTGDIATLETFLMSCRVMGRGVEGAFLDTIIRTLKAEDVQTLQASYIPTPKNQPCRGFLASFGFTFAGDETHARMDYRLDLSSYAPSPSMVPSTIKIIL